MEAVPVSSIVGPHGAPQAITVQPGAFPARADIWMPLPVPVEGVPSGLEYLTMVDKIIIQQIHEVVEVITGFETRNKYALRNANGEQVYYAFEESECCERLCCGPGRGFTMHVVDNFGREVLRIQRPFRCCGRGCYGLLAGVPGCGSECTIESPPGYVIGTVEQRATFCASSFVVKDNKDEVILRIDGPCCCLLCGCQDKEFPVTLPSDEHIGFITKKWGGVLREMFTDADIFGVTFPINLDVRAKAALLGATFLIDFMEFEQNRRRNV
ncbi:hypothetical protein RB195_007461 [Necator americanus]|uniref:Phospholipid scramblase n=1 Tax=Necator americanus TaxID=51031 RepID=A0ABR1BXC9_NECAM